ncbi:response regulator [Sedimenticola hydrogenitrophicus]|uniref:response regulator n=1 Tax=Sedimenticola hydrogenitrophicus TaxID=2967975 RepID=UPI0021A48EE7|nr:response regulator [Sedimenticola hydrogenitrophicus]
MGERETLLVVDDDTQVREMLVDYLSSQGYRVLGAADGESMRALLQSETPALVLLDITLPGEDGLSLARYLRERHDTGIIMVTASGEVIDRIIGLEIGADDYVAKPFDTRELLARIKSVLRRARPAVAPTVPAAEPEQIRIGPCRLHLDSRRLFDADGMEIALTSMEFDLLRIFGTRPNRVLSRDQILNLTQNRDWDPYDRSIDIRIARLRRKIEPDPSKPQVIRTVRGAGYMFVPTAAV